MLMVVLWRRGIPATMMVGGAFVAFVCKLTATILMIWNHPFTWEPDSLISTILPLADFASVLGQGFFAFGFLMIALSLRTNEATI